MKRTFQPSNLVRARRHGFFARKATPGGRKVPARAPRVAARTSARDVMRRAPGAAIVTDSHPGSPRGARSRI